MENFGQIGVNVRKLELGSSEDEKITEDLIVNFDPEKLDDIHSELHKSIAIGLIEKGDLFEFIRNLDKFSGLDQKVALMALKKNGECSREIFQNLNRFGEINFKSFAREFARECENYVIVGNLSNIPENLHKQIAQDMIDVGKIEDVISHLENFQNLDSLEIALRFVDDGYGSRMFSYLKKFNDLDKQKIAEKLVEKGFGILVNFFLNDFPDLDFEKIKMAEKQKKMSSESKEIVKKQQMEMISFLLHDHRDMLFKNLDLFDSLSHQEIAEQIIDYVGMERELFENYEKFKGLDHGVIMKRILEEGKTEKGNMRGGIIVENLDKLVGINLEEAAFILINAGAGDSVAFEFEKFKISPERSNAVALAIIESGNGYQVLKNKEKFHNINLQEVAELLMKTKQGFVIAENLEEFPGYDNQETCLQILDGNEVNNVMPWLDSFNITDLRVVAQKLIDNGHSDILSEWLRKFSGLDKAIGLQLIECGQGYAIDAYEKAFDFEFPAELKLCAHNLLLTELFILEEFAGEIGKSEEKYEKLFTLLSEKDNRWQDKENISGPFEIGKEHFGAEKMFEYIGKKNRHDCLHNFRKITKLAQDSGLSPAAFYGNILHQINKDDGLYGDYDDMPSHIYMNQLAEAVNVAEVNEVILKASSSDIEKLQEISNGFDEKIFSNWKNLKKYYQIIQLLKKTELLKELNELREQGKFDLYNYVTTLALHPNINMEKAMQFWKKPEDFLDVGDDHAPEEHSRKKPSNYTNIPHLDLSALDLRDGLVDGSLDKVQTWKPLEIEYTEKMNIREDIVVALGSRKDGVPGKAKNSKELFQKINRILKNNGIDINNFIHDNKIILDQEIVNEISYDLYGDNGILKPDQVRYKAKINLKSDPDGVVAGNDTACCMPFGSGKSNVYTYNPVCALFTLQKLGGDGSWRTVGQSVLTKDIDIKRNIAEIVDAMSKSDVKMEQFVSENILKSSSAIVACDNIEIAPNFKATNNDKLVEYIYRDFFVEYMKQFGSNENFETNRLIIGKGYTDVFNIGIDIENTFAPLAPVGYSDNLGNKTIEFKLDSSQSGFEFERVVSIRENGKNENVGKRKTGKGVEELTFEDSLRVSFIEGRAYHDNQSLIQQLHNMENALIAKDINNAAKDRPNLSLKYVDGSSKMSGYLLAYEGKDDKGHAIVYISDLAVSGSQLAGGKLIKEFIDAYKKHYIDNGKYPPIVADTREVTSFKIIEKMINKQVEGGVKFKLEEKDVYAVGQDTMHLVYIYPV